VLRPRDRDDVAACLRLANHHRVPIHPVGTARNWGYGGAVPTHDGSVLLSLADLDRISHHDDALGLVTVEPGVTFDQLARFLRRRASRLLAPATGSSPHTSVVGNILERGIGKELYQDLAGHVAGAEALLAAGDPVRLDAAAGSSLLGFLPQSNLVVVTALTIRLEPAPCLRQFTAIFLRDVQEAAGCLDALRDTLQRNHRVGLELMNDYRYPAQSSRFPYGEREGGTPLPRAWVTARLGLPGQPTWIARATAWADSQEELAMRRAAIDAILGPGVAIARGEVVVVAEAEATGSEGLRCAYWRKRVAMPADPDPDRDGCGVIWITPVLPMRGAALPPLVERVEREMLRDGFEPAISLRPDGYELRAVIGILFDRDEPGADGRALACRKALLGVLDTLGLDRYRHGVLDGPPARDAGSGRLLAALKAAADPNGVIAPGRYGPA
jgi:4-cresol dehydrogenase (hydroxylating) flavoprotein subunit